MKAAGGGGESSSTNATAVRPTRQQQQQLPLCSRYPISSQWEFTLTNGETVKGEVYCTDPLSDLLVLQDQLNDIRMVAVSAISEARQVKEAPPAGASSQPAAPSPSNSMVHSKKALEEREKRAIRLAQESLKHLNPKVGSIPLRRARTYRNCEEEASSDTTQLVTHPLFLSVNPKLPVMNQCLE